MDGDAEKLAKRFGVTLPKSNTERTIESLRVSPDEDIAIRTIIGEAKGEGQRGWNAVAGVMRNRAKGGKQTLRDVALAPNQFEPWSSRKKELESIDPNSRTYQDVARTTLPVLRGEVDDPTGGATHFYSPSAQSALGRKPPSWDNGKGLDIGNHRFFNLGYSGQGKHGNAKVNVSAPEPSVDISKLSARLLGSQGTDFTKLYERMLGTAQPPTAPINPDGNPYVLPENVGGTQLPPVNPTGVPLKTNATVMPPVAEQPLAMPDAEVAPVTDKDFVDANNYLVSQGQVPLTRQQFDDAQKAKSTAQATATQLQPQIPTQPQPQGTVKTPVAPQQRQEQVSIPRQLTTDEKQGIVYSKDIDVSQVKGNKKAFAAKKALQEAGLTPAQANTALQRLQKEGNILKGEPTNPNQFRVTLTYDDINWALGGDAKNIVPSVQEMMDVARAQRQAEIPDAVPTITKPDSATERMMEEQLRANAQAGLGAPSLLNTDDISLAIEKMLDDPTQIWTGAPFKFTEEERRKVVDDNITELIKSAGSASKAKALQDEAANMGIPEQVLRSYRDLTDTVKRSPATFARTAAWIEEVTDWGRANGVWLPTVTTTDIGNAVAWLTAKAAGKEYAPMAQGALPNILADSIDKAFPDDPVTRNTMAGKLSRAVGSSAPFMLGAMLTGGTSAATILLGAAQQVGDSYKEAKDSGLSQEKRILAGLAGIPIGASEALGLKWAKLGGLLQKETNGQFVRSVAKWLVGSGKELTEESLQEYFQSTAGKLLITGLKNDGWTKKDVAKALGSSLDDAVTGGIVGLMFGGGIPLVTGNVGVEPTPPRQSRTDALLKTEVPQKTEPESPTLKMGDKITPVSEMKASAPSTQAKDVSIKADNIDTKPDNSGNFEPPVKETKPIPTPAEQTAAIEASSEEVAKADAELETARKAEIFETAKTALSLSFIEPKALPTKAEQAKAQKAMAEKYEFTDVDENGDEFTDTYTGFQRQKELKKRSKSLDTLLKCLNG